jgi:hypothetical protein
VLVSSRDDERGRLGAEVAAAHEPLVILFDAEHPGEPDQALVVREDADDVGAPPDLAVEALERVGRTQLAPVVGRERVEGEDVGLGILQQCGDLGEPPVEVRDGFR